MSRRYFCKFCVLFLSLFTLSTIYSQNLQIISDSLLAELKDKGFVSCSEVKNYDFSFKYCPNTAICKKTINSWTKNEKPVFNSESLYLVSKKTLIENSKDKNNSDVSLNKVSQIIRSVSKMKGMKYYSNSKKKWRTLYHQANLIAGPNDKTYIPDVINDNADGMKLYCVLDDNTFGEGVYELNYSQTENEVSVCFTNIEPLKLGPITGVKKDNLKINLTVVDYGDNFLVYMVTQAYYPSLSILEKKLQESFESRVNAIYNWFLFQF